MRTAALPAFGEDSGSRAVVAIVCGVVEGAREEVCPGVRTLDLFRLPCALLAGVSGVVVLAVAVAGVGVGMAVVAAVVVGVLVQVLVLLVAASPRTGKLE